MRDQDAETTLVVHIETRAGWEKAEEIISTPGVDMVYLGPDDFSIALGHPGDYDHPDVAGPMEQILALCKRYQVPFGTTPSSPEAAGRWVAAGAPFFDPAAEFSLLFEAASPLVPDHPPSFPSPRTRAANGTVGPPPTLSSHQ